MFDLRPAPARDSTSAIGVAPISYRVRESARSRRVYLRVLPGQGLVITVPRGFPRRDLPALMESKRAWIEKSLAELEARTPAHYRQWPPERLTLGLLQRDVDIHYCKHGKDDWFWSAAGSLVCRVDSEQREVLVRCVAAALKQLARAHLSARLSDHASLHGLAYRKVVVRGQRSVWGSYSSTGTLSLNYKLLFLPPALGDYVLLHELAHTRHLNHSDAFWALLETLAPGSRKLDAQLNDAGRLVPPWLELAR